MNLIDIIQSLRGHSMNRKGLLAICCLTLIAGNAMGGEVYKWVDAQGRTHYSNQRPTEVEEVEVLEVFDAASAPSPPSPTEELARIKEFTRQLREEREDLERQRLEARLDALEDSYQQLLEEKDRYPREREVIWTYAIPPFIHPPLPPHPHPHGRFKFHKDMGKAAPFKQAPMPPSKPQTTPRERGSKSVVFRGPSTNPAAAEKIERR